MNWFFLNSGKGDPAFNMALDEALLEAVSRLQRPVLRFYGWTEPAATFGYFQRYADVERATLLRPLIRRPTGGGVVPHDADWTYSFVAPPGHEWHSLKAEESYRRIHQWIQSAFARLRIETKLAPSGKTLSSLQEGGRVTPCAPSASNSDAAVGNRGAHGVTRPPSQSEMDQSLLTSAATAQCFMGYEKFDLLWNGKKIAGAAQRRNKLGLLIQGSVQPPMASARLEWENAMRAVARREFGIQWNELVREEKLSERAGTLVREKFSQKNFNQKR